MSVALLARTRGAELVHGGVLVIRLASINDTAEVALGIVPRGAVVLASPGARRAAFAPPPRSRQLAIAGAAAAAATVPSKVLRAALALRPAEGSPLAWALQSKDAAVFEAVALANTAEVLRWAAVEPSGKDKDVGVVWGWQLPPHLAGPFLDWAEPGTARDARSLLGQRCCRLSFAVLPEGCRAAAAARALKAEAACSEPVPGGANVQVSMCMRPAIAGDIGCAAGLMDKPQYSHLHSQDRTSKTVARHASSWEAGAACGDPEAAAALAALRRSRRMRAPSSPLCIAARTRRRGRRPSRTVRRYRCTSARGSWTRCRRRAASCLRWWAATPS